MDGLKKIAEKLEEMLKVNLEDIQRVYGETIYKAILDEENKDGIEYIGGELIFECVDDKNFTCAYSLYFQDQQEKFFKKEAKTGEVPLKSLSPEMRKELQSERILKFEIPEMTEEIRGKYKVVRK